MLATVGNASTSNFLHAYTRRPEPSFPHHGHVTCVDPVSTGKESEGVSIHSHPIEFRQRAVEPRAQGAVKLVAQLAKDLGISESCLRNWMSQADDRR